MNFTAAVKTAFAKYAVIQGRASRSEYWYFVLFLWLTSWGLLCGGYFLGGMSNGDGELHISIPLNLMITAYSLITLVPNITVFFRRLHDTNHSEWNVLWLLVPVIGWIIVLIWLCSKGTDGDNRFGDDPLAETRPSEAAAPISGASLSSDARIVLTVFLVVGIVGAIGGGIWFAKGIGFDGAESAVAVTEPSSSIWTLSEEQDPMTDAVQQTASARFEQSPFGVEVNVRCTSDGEISYEFLTFESGDEPSSMRQQTNFDVLKIPYVQYEIRLDDGPAKQAISLTERYTNQLVIDGRGDVQNLSIGHVIVFGVLGAVSPSAKAVAAANRLRLRIPLMSGDVTVDMDQTDPVLSKVIGACRYEIKKASPEESGVPLLDDTTTISSDVDTGEDAIAEDAAEARFSEVGKCENTKIATIGTRLEGNTESGSSVLYANGIFGVSYDRVEELVRSSVGDPVRICLVELPTDCPANDLRGRIYSAENLRTHGAWQLMNSSHLCGGA